MDCLIFANGELYDGEAVQAAIRRHQAAPAEFRLVICADGGLRHALEVQVTPDLIIGDMDSVDFSNLETEKRAGAEIRVYPSAKEETDLELCLLAAAEHNCQQITILGAVGGRLDQTLSNIYLLALPVLKGREVRLVSGRETSWLAFPGESVIKGTPGDTVSLIPLASSVVGILTEGLHYPLRGETLHVGPARGVSNVLDVSEARLWFGSGLLLIVHTLGRA